MGWIIALLVFIILLLISIGVILGQIGEMLENYINKKKMIQ